MPRLVEHEGALYRIAGPTNAYPDEVWDPNEREFVPYKGDVPKDVDWGSDISDREAAAIMHPEVNIGNSERAAGA